MTKDRLYGLDEEWDDPNEYEEDGLDLFDEEEELDFGLEHWDREEGHIYESIEAELPELEKETPNDDGE